MLVDRSVVEAALPGYDVGEVVGAGSFGLVRIGRHRGLNRSVAIKILIQRPELTSSALRDRFGAEARILAGLGHPHVVRVFDYVERGDLCLLVMEHLGGGTLSAKLAQDQPTEFGCAVGIAAADALHAAHLAGVLHRDIKPSNMLFAADGLMKVADFGIAKLFGGSAASASGVAGTFGFMQPEQIRAGRLGPATDLYALAMVLYRLFTGRMPFDTRLPLDQLLRLQMETVPPPPDSVPPAISDLVVRSLAIDLDHRPSSARAFAFTPSPVASVGN